MNSPDIETLLAREAHRLSLIDLIRKWQSDPKAYDLRLVAHELQKATGRQDPGGMAPGEFIALLGRCKLRGANPPAPVPPKSALQLEQEHRARLLEEEGVLLQARPLYHLPAAFRSPWDHPWEAVEAAEDGSANSRLVLFDWPQAPDGSVLFIGAEMGNVPGRERKELWYRAYCKIHRPPVADVQILAEGTAKTVTAARMAVKRKLMKFAREQCEAEPPLEKSPPPTPTELYTVQVRLSRDDIDDLGGWRHEAELSAVVSTAIEKFAADRRKLREKRAAARAARKAAA
jgi:hypothetical protein